MSYAPGHDPRNADDTPEYPGWVTEGWNYKDWMLWFQSLTNKHGIQEAHDTFVVFWAHFPPFMYPYAWLFNSDFYQFLVVNKLDDPNFLFDVTEDVKDTIKKTVHSGGSIIDNALQTVDNTLGAGKYVVPGLLVGGAILLLLIITSKGRTAINAV